MRARDEQDAFAVQQKAQLRARVRYVAETNKDLTWEALAERFGLDSKTIVRWCGDIPRENAVWWADNRKRGGE